MSTVKSRRRTVKDGEDDAPPEHNYLMACILMRLTVLRLFLRVKSAEVVIHFDTDDEIPAAVLPLIPWGGGGGRRRQLTWQPGAGGL